MVNQKITDNFSYYEFRPRNAPSNWLPDNNYQALLIKVLAENLQVIRSAMPYGSSITITSGARNESDIQDLLNSGYNPSETSDHLCGISVKLNKNNPKYIKFGPTYNFTCGAADCVPNGMSISDFFILAMNKTKANHCRFGQVIHEYNPDTKAEWVHFSNDPSTFFSSPVVSLINRQKFLESKDGGKTYQTIMG